MILQIEKQHPRLDFFPLNSNFIELNGDNDMHAKSMTNCMVVTYYAQDTTVL